MTKIDQFESTFKAATRTLFNYEAATIRKCLVVTDLAAYEAKLYGDRVRAFLAVLGDQVEWHDAAADDCNDLGKLLALIEAQRPDLICTYRHLHSGGWRWPYGLGEHLDVLTQITTTPVLVLPRPDNPRLESLTRTKSVMAMTSDLTGDHHLVSVAAHLTDPHGKLVLTHVEDHLTFERYIDAIGKIPTIDTRAASSEIEKRLLKEARDYIESCRDELREHGMTFSVESVVSLGHHLTDYKTLIDEHDADLLVLNTKDDDQMAMHGLAYPLAVELRDHCLLLL